MSLSGSSGGPPPLCANASGAIKDHLVGELELAEYLLFLLNQATNRDYVARCGLREPTDDVTTLLSALGRRFGAVQAGGAVNLEASAQRFLAMFRAGQLGRFTLDDLSPEGVAAHFEHGRRNTAEA